jgi:hypothetical protein
MKTIILKIAILAIIAAPLLSRGQDTNIVTAAPAQPLPPPPVVATPAAEEMPAATNAPVKPKKIRTTLAVTGKVVNVDTNAMTLTIGKRTYEITSETHIIKAGAPAILSDIAVDDKVSVTYKKADGKFNAIVISDGKKSAAADAQK